jgi:gliding motility-associated-like protein
MLCFSAAVAFAFADGSPVNNDPESLPVPCQTASLAGVNVTCYGLANGSATLTINQAGTYKVIWSNGVTINSTTILTHSITGLTAGYYDVQVINLSNGCSAFDIINITQPAPIVPSVVVTDVKCFGQTTGAVDLTVTGGTPAYSYSWSSGQSSQDLNGIASGTYLVTITDTKGCSAYDTAVVVQPAQALGQSLNSLSPTCNGYNNGWVDLTVWGGVTPYTYNWNSGAYASQDLNNLPAGNYSVVIRDANNCSLNTSVTLTDPPLLTLGVTSVNNLCYGYELGSIDATVAGGTLPYTYQWANSDYVLSWSTQDLSLLPADKYYLTVTDAQGCSRRDSATITSPTMITSSIVSTDVTTFGGVNGSITMSVSGGVIPYTFLWSNGASSQNLSGIPAGWYHVTITDANLCTREDSVYISEPLSPLSASLEHKNVSCFGGNDGWMKATASGGTPPYTFVWSNNDHATQINALNAGVYSITVTDFFGNTFSTSDTIKQPNPITFTQTITSVTCFGLPDGAIDVTVSGGTPSYTYEWYNSQYVLAALTQDISGMPADQYYLEVTDTLGCSGSVTLSISQPVALSVQMSHTDVYCAGYGTATAACVAAGGSQPYTYLWSNGDNSPQIDSLYSGSYTVTVTDSNSCFVTDSVKVVQSDSIKLDFTSTPVSCIDQHDGKAAVYATGGNGDYNYSWSNGAVIPQIEDIDAGLYSVLVTDLMGCTGEGSVMVLKNEIECISIPSCFTPNDDGTNDTWIIKDAELYPQLFLEIYNRWGQKVFGVDGSYEAWDGKYKGNPMPAETYYYFLRITPESQTIQGTLTIVR